MGMELYNKESKGSVAIISQQMRNALRAVNDRVLSDLLRFVAYFYYAFAFKNVEKHIDRGRVLLQGLPRFKKHMDYLG